ncbi:MAG: GAF domain-containing protein [Polyangiaceae bacterium]
MEAKAPAAGRTSDELGDDDRDTASETKALAEARARTMELELELSSLANLYVASFQLASTLRLEGVVTHLHELLTQLIGAHSYGVYFVNRDGDALVPIRAFGTSLEPIPVSELPDENPASTAILAAFRNGHTDVASGDFATRSSGTPIACVPLRLESAIVGVVAVFELHPHKTSFSAIDHPLFNLLGTHAAGALVSSELFARAGGKVPPAEDFRKAMD